MKIIIGNWKMNGSRQLLSNMLVRINDIANGNRVILCVPYTMLRGGTKNIEIGAQDVSKYEHGAYTGQVSAKMIHDTGAKYTLVGHSEARKYNKDTNKTVKEKAFAAISGGITPIICVGETFKERETGQTNAILAQIVKDSVPKIKSDMIVAYEPRWAIGAGVTPTMREISEAYKVIRKTLLGMGLKNIPILYGGGITGANVSKIIKYVDGVLVGGASLKIDDFIPIIENVK